MKNSLKYIKFTEMSHHFPDTHCTEWKEFIILNIFISVAEEREIEGVNYSRIRDLSKSCNVGRWVALSRKEIEKHTPIGSVEELVDMTLSAKKQKGLK
jgi:hypothetical protein